MESTAPAPVLFSADNLAWINARVREDATLTRYRLCQEVCVRLDLRDAQGRPREMACRKQLLTLERRGRIVLPPPVRAPPRRGATLSPAPVRTAFAGTLASLGPVNLIPLTGGTEASRAWNTLMRTYHPHGDGPLCGAQIRYLIVSATHGTLGGLAVSAAAWRLKARDGWLGWSDAGRAAGLAGLVCNSRFLILPDVRVKHLASHVLGQLARRIGRDWRDRYGIAPWLMETCVEATQTGTSYRAANWIELGLTAGRGRQDRANKAALTQKRVFVLPLDRAAFKRMCPDSGTAPAGWVHREFGGAHLGDARLDARLLGLATAFFARPQANIPQACGSAAAAKAAYRFFDNDKVTMDALLEPHHRATIARMRREPIVLVAQDTTSLCYTMRPEMKGIGPIGNRADGPQGIVVHTAQAFTPAGLPLGLLDIEAWARDPAEFGKSKDCNNKPIEEKESFKWPRALTPIAAAAALCPGTRVIATADREADFFEYLDDARVKGVETIVRAKVKNRALADNDVQKLWPHMLLKAKAGTVELAVPRRRGQPARVALLTLRFDTVTLKPPAGKKHLSNIETTVVLAREQTPPPGVKQPLEWMLLTSAPVAGLADAIERIRWYAGRWGIEVFHRILKSGCQIEDRQLGAADRLEACLAIDAVVAWRIHHLTWLGRATPDLPCDTVLDDDLWKGVIVFKTGKPPPAKPPGLKDMIREIASLGGFLGRKADGEPGSETLWRGLQRANDIAAMFRGMRAAYTLPS